ncbi:MAG: (d)CMP kinase, partial [Nevskiales bacterium]
MSTPVITIDGPSGSGKGTIARRLAGELNWAMLDSGALYRLLALAAKSAGLSPENAEQVEQAAALIPAMNIHFGSKADSSELIELDSVDVTHEVRLESTGNLASRYASNPLIRGGLLQLQRDFRQAPGLVADGRDMGTVVFPDAPLKFFLTASVEERTRRRVLQLSEMGITANIDRIYSEIEARDARDRSRTESPLVPAEDAIALPGVPKRSQASPSVHGRSQP